MKHVTWEWLLEKLLIVIPAAAAGLIAAVIYYAEYEHRLDFIERADAGQSAWIADHEAEVRRLEEERNKELKDIATQLGVLNGKMDVILREKR